MLIIIRNERIEKIKDAWQKLPNKYKNTLYLFITIVLFLFSFNFFLENDEEISTLPPIESNQKQTAQMIFKVKKYPPMTDPFTLFHKEYNPVDEKDKKLNEEINPSALTDIENQNNLEAKGNVNNHPKRDIQLVGTSIFPKGKTAILKINKEDILVSEGQKIDAGQITGITKNSITINTLEGTQIYYLK